MAKVKNNAGRALTVLRWTILLDGRVIDPLGSVKQELPDEIAYSPQAKRLVDSGLATFPGVTPEAKVDEPVLVELEVEVQEDSPVPEEESVDELE